MVEGVVFCGLSIFLLSFSRDSWLYVISGFFLLSFSSFMGMWSWSAMWKGVISWGGIDGLSSGLLSLTFWLGAMMMLASYSSYSSSGTTSFCCMISLLTFILLLCFCFTNFFMFYIVFELSLVPTLMLILGWGYQPERLQAGSYMMMYTISASLPFLVCLLYWSVTFGGVSFFLINSFSLKDLWFLSFLGFWFVLAFLVKLPMYFVHLWLPKAHVEAPVAGSMILAGILLKLGGYGLMRIVTLVGEGVYSLLEFLGILSIWGGILTSLVCLRQSDVKALIAYSSVAHMGLMLGGLMTFSVNGWQGGLMMMLAHGMASSGLFALAGLQYEFFSSRSVVLNKGLLCVFPFMALWWFLLSACNMASPPSMNLVSELLLIMSMLMYSSYLSFFIFLLGVLAGAYSIYLYVSVNHGKYSNFVHPLVGNSMGRIGVMFLCHWVPLNILILKVDVLLF